MSLGTGTHHMADTEGGLRDTELFGEKAEIAHQEAIHHGKLTAEELAIEKKLRLKIDLRIMPLVILVYLMNYIDRCVLIFALLVGLNTDIGSKQ